MLRILQARAIQTPRGTGRRSHALTTTVPDVRAFDVISWMISHVLHMVQSTGTRYIK